MRDRLQKFMDLEKLSASRMAEILGVQPATISHILSGRNKPSFEFIERMLLRFPKLNPEWFILGKGAVYRVDVLQTVAPEGKPDVSSSLSSPQAHEGTAFQSPDFPISKTDSATSAGSLEMSFPSFEQVDRAADLLTDPVRSSSDSTSSRINSFEARSAAGRSDALTTAQNGSNGDSKYPDNRKLDDLSSTSNSDQRTSISAKSDAIDRIVIFFMDGTCRSFDPKR